jgi:hypothetical protein
MHARLHTIQGAALQLIMKDLSGLALPGSDGPCVAAVFAVNAAARPTVVGQHGHCYL